MVCRTRNLSNCKIFKSRKAQFYVLSAFAIVSIIYLVSTWIESYTIIDTSSIPLMEEPFVFNNMKEKAVEVVKNSNDCENLQYNLDEYKAFVENYGMTKNFNITLTPSVQNCDGNTWTVKFDLILKSPRVLITSFNFTVTK